MSNEHQMLPEVLSATLRPEHRAIGLYLEMDNGLLFLNQQDEPLPIKVFLPTAPIADILFEADQVLEWSKSGITFEKKGG